MKPVAMFTDMQIIKGKNGVEFMQGKNGEYVTFLAKEINSYSDEITVHSFIAFGDVCEKIKKMKLKVGSRIHMTCHIKKYVTVKKGPDEKPYSKQEYNFDIMDLSFTEAAQNNYPEKKKEVPRNLPEDPFSLFSQRYPNGGV